MGQVAGASGKDEIRTVAVSLIWKTTFIALHLIFENLDFRERQSG